MCAYTNTHINTHTRTHTHAHTQTSAYILNALPTIYDCTIVYILSYEKYFDIF